MGKGEQIMPDSELHIMYEGSGFVMVKEIGPYARMKLFEMGYDVIISYKGEGVDDTFRFSIVRLSSGHPLDQLALQQDLNSREGIPDRAVDRWGGGKVFSGSSRQAGSKIAPNELCTIVGNYCQKS
jgi:hypothetical protein